MITMKPYGITSGTTLLLITFFIPESPFHLIVKNKMHKAQKALRRLRGPNYDYKSELEEMQEDLEVQVLLIEEILYNLPV